MKKILLPLILILCLVFSVYCFATAWDVSTASYDSKYKSVHSEEIYPSDVVFKPDGSKMYIVGYANDSVYQYSLSTAWDVSTASYDSKYKDVSSEDNIPVSVAFKSDGSKMYIVGYSSDRVYQYSLPVEVELNNSIFFGCNF